jgi:hypothetical protein
MYEELVRTLDGLLASSEWTTLIEEPVYPHDYKERATSVPYLKYQVVPGKVTRPSYQNKKKLIGLIQVSIFYESGSGQLAPALIADKLDQVLQDAIPSVSFQLQQSYIQYLGPDRDNTTLSRADYWIPFTFYGD